MAWYDAFPGNGPAGGDWLSGLSDPYGSYTPDGLSGQLPNWYDRFPGAGAGGGDPLSSFLGASPWTPNYGIGSLGGGYNPSPLLSGANFALRPTMPPLSGSFGMSSFPSLASSFPGFSQGGFGQQSFGGQPQMQSPQMGRGGFGGGQQSLGGLPSQMPGYGQPQQSYAPQQTGYSGGTSNPANVRGSAGAGVGQVLPPGGVYGAQKWSTPMGSNAVDIFVPRGTPVTAPVSGTLQPGSGGRLILVGDNGLSFAFRHGQTTAQGHVQAGQPIGVVNDPGMDMLGQAPWGNMPDGYQHLEMSVSQGNYFPDTPGGGGNIDAAQWLESTGYRGTKISKTPGPPDARGGGGMGMGMGQGGMFGAPGGFGQGGSPGMQGGFPGMQGGFPGMQGSPFGGNPMMSMFSGGMGQGGLGGLPGMFNPMMAMFSGGFGR